MSVFGNPWGDIDRTPKDAPYIVDENGWGWFALMIIAVIPFFMIGFALRNVAAFVADHPLLYVLICLLINGVTGAVVYRRKGFSWNIIGITATVLTFAPVVVMEALVEVPMIMKTGDSIGENIELFIEWFFITLFFVGIGILIQAANMLRPVPIRHLIISIIFCFITFLILMKVMTPERIEDVHNVYNILQL